MRPIESAVDFLWRNERAASRYSSAVSLHSHTNYSREGMDFLPVMLRSLPSLGIGASILNFFEDRHRLHYGKGIDFSRAHWTPPLSPMEAYELERRQIGESLGIEPHVSLTDHDEIAACLEVRRTTGKRDIPISLEWTLPFMSAVFHLGIHNIPPDKASSLHGRLIDYKESPHLPDLFEILDELVQEEDLLIVLNHPFSDQGRIGRTMHEKAVIRFLDDCGRWIHALELNALQRWNDNVAVARLAKERGYPIVSGGDRHGLEPNGSVNLTNAATFSEFVHEVRTGCSRVLLMPQCEHNITVRYIKNIFRILSPHGAQAWHERVFYRCDDGLVRSLRDVLGTHGKAVGNIDLIIRLLDLLVGGPTLLAQRILCKTSEELEAMKAAFKPEIA